MDREMKKETVKVRVQDELEPIEQVIVKERVIAAEYAKLFQLSTGVLNRVILERYLKVHQFFTRNEKLKQFQGAASMTETPVTSLVSEPSKKAANPGTTTGRSLCFLTTKRRTL